MVRKCVAPVGSGKRRDCRYDYVRSVVLNDLRQDVGYQLRRVPADVELFDR